MKSPKGGERRATRAKRLLRVLAAAIPDYATLIDFLATLPKAERRETYDLIEPHLSFVTTGDYELETE